MAIDLLFSCVTRKQYKYFFVLYENFTIKITHKETEIIIILLKQSTTLLWLSDSSVSRHFVHALLSDKAKIHYLAGQWIIIAHCGKKSKEKQSIYSFSPQPWWRECMLWIYIPVKQEFLPQSWTVWACQLF